MDNTLRPIGQIQSTLTERKNAPRQGNEGAPDAWIEIHPAYATGMRGIAVGDEMLIFTWFHRSNRDTLEVYPRGNPPLTGVFATRSPDRPNPIGLHRVTVHDISGLRLRIGPIEAIDGTPVVDIKPILANSDR